MATKNDIREQIRRAPWSELKIRLGNGSLFNIPYQVDFVQVGLAVANDDEATLRHYMNLNALKPPTEAQISKWELLPDKSFQYLIIEGHVLIQEVIEKKF